MITAAYYDSNKKHTLIFTTRDKNFNLQNSNTTLLTHYLNGAT